MDNFPRQQNKIFSPIVLFNDHPSASSSALNKDNISSNQRRQSLIEKHLKETQKRLDTNAKLWKSERKQPIENEQSSVHKPLPPQPSTTLADEAVVGSLTELQNHYSNSTYITSAPTWIDPYIPQPSSSLDNSSRDEAGRRLQYQTIILDAYQNNAYNHQQNATRNDTGNGYFTTNFPFISEQQHCNTYESYMNKKRRRENLPKEATEYLKKWLFHHKRHPYPTEREKKQLADDTNLAVGQISNWFINARRRILQPFLQSEINEQEEQEEQEQQEHQQLWQRGACLDGERYHSSTYSQPTASYPNNTIHAEQFTTSSNGL